MPRGCGAGRAHDGARRAVPGGGVRARWRPPSRPGCGWDGTRGASSACRSRPSSAAGIPRPRHGRSSRPPCSRSRCGRRRGCSRPRSGRPRSPPRCSGLTLALRLALGAASHGTSGWDTRVRPRRARGAERVPARAERAALRPGLLPRPLRGARARAARPRRRAPAGPAARDGRARDHHAGAARRAVHRGRRAGRPADVRHRPEPARRAPRAARRAVGRHRAVRAAVRRHLGGRALRHARPARRVAARRAPPGAARRGRAAAGRRPRCSRGPCSRSAPGRRCSRGGATGVRAMLALGALCAVALLAVHARVRGADRLRPDRRRCGRPSRSTASGSPTSARTGSG